MTLEQMSLLMLRMFAGACCGIISQSMCLPCYSWSDAREELWI